MLLGLAVGLGLFSYGLFFSHVLPLPSWDLGGPWRFVCFTGVFAAITALIFFTGPARRGQWLGGAFLFWLVVAFGVGAVAAVALIGAAALALGDLLFGGGWRDRFGLLPAALLALCVGLVPMMWLVDVASHAPVNLPAVYLVVLGVPVLVGAGRLGIYAGGLRRWLTEATFSPGCYAAAALLVFVLVMQSLYAALPEQYYDALAIHLTFASTLAAQTQWTFDPGHLLFSAGPRGADCLFAVGYLLGGETAAKLVNFGLMAMIAALFGSEIGRRYGRVAGLEGAALFASVPLAFIVTTSLFSENTLTVFGLAATLVLVRAGTAVSRTDIFALAVLLAGGVLVKLTGVFFLLACGGWLAVVLARQGRVLSMVPALLLGTALVAPPYVYSWLCTGNPFFPLLNGIFKSSLFPPINFTDMRWSGKLGWDLLYRWTFESSGFLEGFNGALGFGLIVLLLPGLAGTLAGRDRGVRLALPLLIIGIYMLGVVPSTQYLRYFYPILPLAALIAAGTLELLPLLQPARAARVAAAFALGAAGLIALDVRAIPTGGWILGSFDPQVVLDRSRQAAWLALRVPTRHFVEAVNALAGAESHVLFVGTEAGAGLQGRGLYDNWYDPVLLKELGDAQTATAAGQVLQRNGITHAIVAPDRDAPNDQVQAYLEQHGRLIAEANTVRLYEVLPDATIGDERLDNSDFKAGFSGWGRIGETTLIPPHETQALLSTGSTLVQAISVTPAEVLIHAVQVSCGSEHTDFQLQVNWLDKDGTILDVLIEPHACTKPGDMEIVTRRVVPAKTVAGAFFINVIGGAPLVVNRISAKSQ
jgi:hypothetical protein